MPRLYEHTQYEPDPACVEPVDLHLLHRIRRSNGPVQRFTFRCGCRKTVTARQLPWPSVAKAVFFLFFPYLFPRFWKTAAADLRG